MIKMTKRELEEIERLEGIGELPDGEIEVEEADEDCFCGFEPDEIVEEVQVDDIEEVDEEYLPEQDDEELEENRAVEEDKESK